MRLFVSVDLEGLADDVARVQDRLADAAGLTFVDPDQAHVTLKFLDEQPPEELPALTGAIERGVAAADVGPFEAHFAGLGVFPSRDYIRVVWVGVRSGSRQLTRLHEHVETELVAQGLDPADHAFTPHVTIARMRHAGGKERVQTALDEMEPDVGTLAVTEVRLTESTRTEDGPVYETVQQFPLGETSR